MKGRMTQERVGAAVGFAFVAVLFALSEAVRGLVVLMFLLASLALLGIAAIAWIPSVGPRALQRVGWRRLPGIGRLGGIGASAAALGVIVAGWVILGTLTQVPAFRTSHAPSATPAPAASASADVAAAAVTSTPTAPATPTQTLTPIPTRSPAPATATPTPAPLAYQVVSRTDYPSRGRARTAIRVIIPGESTPEQKIATLAEIARRERRPNVVVVFAFRSAAEERCCQYTVGVASLSTDRLGWAGDGVAMDGAKDTGAIQGKVVLAVDERLPVSTSERAFSVSP